MTNEVNIYLLYHSDRHRCMLYLVLFKNIVLVGDFNSHDFKISKVVVDNQKKKANLLRYTDTQ
jgi:hypothetical protein